MTFKMIAGKYVVPGRFGCLTVRLRAGDVIKSGTNLASRFPTNFIQVSDDTPVTIPDLTRHGLKSIPLIPTPQSPSGLPLVLPKTPTPPPVPGLTPTTTKDEPPKPKEEPPAPTRRGRRGK